MPLAIGRLSVLRAYAPPSCPSQGRRGRAADARRRRRARRLPRLPRVHQPDRSRPPAVAEPGQAADRPAERRRGGDAALHEGERPRGHRALGPRVQRQLVPQQAGDARSRTW